MSERQRRVGPDSTEMDPPRSRKGMAWHTGEVIMDLVKEHQRKRLWPWW